VALLLAAGCALAACGSTKNDQGHNAQSAAYCQDVQKLTIGLAATSGPNSQIEYLHAHEKLINGLPAKAPGSELKATKSLVSIIDHAISSHNVQVLGSPVGQKDSNKIKHYCGISG
jgi:hypothetical protein